jgi:hypothetical protein
MTAVAKNVDMRKSLKGQSISMMLYGLQNMNSKEMIVKKLLLAVAIMISECSDKFDPQAIGNAFYGLQGMSSVAVMSMKYVM